MRQRRGSAQAVLGKPEGLVLDEPTNGVDPAGIQEMRSLIAEMPRTGGATVLISRHLLSELEMIVDQVGIINNGQLLFQGPLELLRRHSRGEILLEVLDPDLARRVLAANRIRTGNGGPPRCLQLPALPEASLAELVRRLADQGAGVVGVTRRTKTLEEIFLSLTEAGKEVG